MVARAEEFYVFALGFGEFVTGNCGGRRIAAPTLSTALCSPNCNLKEKQGGSYAAL